MIARTVSVFLVSIALTGAVFAAETLPPGERADVSPSPLDALAAAATSTDPAASGDAIAKLRSIGPDGLAALTHHYGDAIARHRADPADIGLWKNPGWPAISAALDKVAALKDAWAADLYWYTDLGQAKNAAAAKGRPILTLRLLGTLDSDLSCANSRFFRTALYANRDVAAYLRDHYVLHWQSVRPVPTVTIDFGDGRVVKRTITGNSIHYILASDGTVIDGLPGLYGPAAFLRHVTAAAELASRLDRTADRYARQAMLANWHFEASANAARSFAADLRAVGDDSSNLAATMAPVGMQLAAATPKGGEQPRNFPRAAQAAPRAFAKTVGESKLVAAVAPPGDASAKATVEDAWTRIAARHADDARLDAGGRSVVAAKSPRLARSPDAGTAADPLAKLVAAFEQSMAIDTVRNEYTFHRTIHGWLGGAEKVPTVDALNDRVYAELFLTPKADPWLGLLPADTYTGIEDDGGR